METEKKNFFEDTKDLAERYVEDKMLLIKLELAEKSAEATSSLVRIVVMAVLSFFVLLIVTFLVGYYLSVLTSSVLLGFSLVAILYLLLMLLFNYIHKKSFGKRIADKVVEGFFRTREGKI